MISASCRSFFVSWATILELPAKGGASSFYQSAESRLIHINEPQIIPTLPYNPEATSAASAHSHIRFVMTGALCNDRWQTKRHFRGKSSERASPRLAVSGVPVVEPRALNCVKLCRRGPRMKQCCGATKPFFGAAKTPRNDGLIFSSRSNNGVRSCGNLSPCFTANTAGFTAGIAGHGWLKSANTISQGAPDPFRRALVG
jgi:hypothetical protein